jgi:predicted transglutaminase-like cysteine proteinase
MAFAVAFFQPLTAAVPELYEEIRVRNAKIESRLADWLNRARLHADHMTTSDHPTLVKWREQLAMLDFSDEVSALQQLNKFINDDITYVNDYHHFHKSDYWADPETTLLEGGDCEDIALIKASVLQRFGWPAERKHLLVGLLTERGRKESHAVLLVETSTGDQLILRSITDEVVHPSDYDFIPIYAVDQHGTLIVKSRNPQHLLHTRQTAAQ